MNSLPPSFQTAANDGIADAHLMEVELRAKMADAEQAPEELASKFESGAQTIPGVVQLDRTQTDTPTRDYAPEHQGDFTP